MPEIIPVVVFNESPVGKLGDTEYEVTLPVTVGESGVMAEFFVNVFGEV